MKIFSAEQVKKLDAFTIAKEPIRSIDLMERAAKAAADWLIQHFPKARHIKIFCGLGNNGGDGLAIARMLLAAKYPVSVYALRHSETVSDDFRENEKRLRKFTDLKNIRETTHIPFIGHDELVIDALFGTGLSRPLANMPAFLVEHINQSGADVVAIDTPSGLFSDVPSHHPAIIRATHTLSFQQPKLAFMMPENAPYVGEWHVLPIGLSPEWIKREETPYYLLDPKMITSVRRKAAKFAHKGTFGHVLIIAGSYGKIGAATLAVKAALRSGVGLVTAYIPRCGYEVVQLAVPEAMCLTDKNTQIITSLPDLSPYSAIAVGPGIGQAPATLAMLEQLLEQSTVPLVLDADALNLIGSHERLLSSLPKGSVLTPHPGEFKRLCGDCQDDFQRIEKLQAFSRQYESVCLLKGAHTAIALPDGRVWFNATGNPGMASGGMGDTLTGMIGGLLAQKFYTPEAATKMGVYIHGLAGDLALSRESRESLTASDLIAYLGQAFKEFN